MIQGTISEETSEMEEKNEQTRAAVTVDSPGHPVHLETSVAVMCGKIFIWGFSLWWSEVKMPRTEKALQPGHENQKHRLDLSAVSVWLSLFPMADLEKSARGGHKYF